MIMIAIPMLSFVVFACNTLKRSTRQLTRISINNPELIADYAAKHYPPIVTPVSSDTINMPDTSLLAAVDSLNSLMSIYKHSAKQSQKTADSALLVATLKNDTLCKALILDLKRTINQQHTNLVNANTALEVLKAQLQYIKDHPLTITNTVSVLDSAGVYVVNKKLQDAEKQIASKDGNIEQLQKANTKKNISIIIMVVFITLLLFIKRK